MFFCKYRKLFSVFILIPIAFLFLSCCCLKADASPGLQKKSNCGACPKTESQNDKSHNQDDCPHAKIRAIVDADVYSFNIVKNLSVTLVVVSTQQDIFPAILKRFAYFKIDKLPHYSALSCQNPILRV